jgi:hypothetical protein
LDGARSGERVNWNCNDAQRLSNQMISHRRILEKLGGGGTDVVFDAQDLRLDRL